MPRLVRRAPLGERIKAYLDPYDFLLSLSETLNDDAYEEWLKIWAIPIGISLNILFILARGASKTSTKGGDDVFGEDGSSSGWFAWLCAFVVHALTFACCLNAFYTFFRSRHYRLFEQPVDIPPPTPSAHRVKVDSSPASASPLRYLQNVIASSTAASRAYPDAEREVWEVSVWHPRPLNLTIFTLFSPGHLLIYYLLLPPAALDSRPSVTVMQAVAFSILLSLQLGFLKTSFSRQSKDTALVHGEVMNEYDTKFVHPFLNRPVRDVGIQTRESATSPRGTRTREVDIYTPTTIIKRRFKTNPNPNYARQYDPDNLAAQPSESRRASGYGTPTVGTPTHVNGYVNAQTQSRPRPSLGTADLPRPRPSASAADLSSPVASHYERLKARSPMKGDGGSLGVYSHAASPLRKAASSNQLGLGREGADQRIASPLKKRVSTPYGSSAINPATRRESGRF
ncbi:hypothetical protein CLAFUW4_08149 [Fulvia fulva]|uniref:Meiotically up-regulated gene 154 protein n=1 Tax=Passalora fulva TaxID=5499 RepID=A0A9Q8P6V6_PASFU|nr:uncharacterized protein CLAFUR5_08263 [Fulvia fulva]KAK4629423.1 hypothetical protein CLAFUR4_08154 [Fulvia fulva]KAK4630817.1 hypothetical protein CLAFUR0_08149 [Fulvia fulva]UJO15540.1 hypothetical protein CLAFUR5_08263 [Fulvia fulva]WPV12112.1 hypothetical protein CLAFUW4_08149 [Fulvia fulva]WPV27954.1 hypothetical protein CLAFUW7_08149 [Fulvia fulva]